MGRGGAIFSISRAMAFASYAPTQIGSIVSLWTSFQMIMGVPLLGSIISALIFTSISIALYPLARNRAIDHCSVEAVCLSFCHQHIHYLTFEAGRARKVYYFVASRVTCEIILRSCTLALDQY